jgi:hypothetical protein
MKDVNTHITQAIKLLRERVAELDLEIEGIQDFQNSIREQIISLEELEDRESQDLSDSFYEDEAPSLPYFYEAARDDNSPRVGRPPITVTQCSPNSGRKIATFESMTEAAAEVGLKNSSAITRAINTGGLSAGYRWRLGD